MKSMRTLLSLMLAIIITSCSTSNDVVSNRSIQKRKYNSGFYFAFNKKISNKKNDTADNIVDTKDVDEALQVNETKETSPQAFEKIEINEVSATANFDELIPEEDYNSSSKEIKQERKERGALFPNLSNKNISLNFTKPVQTQKNIESNNSSSGGDMFILLVILCFFLPWLSVGLYTDWDVMLTVVSLLLWFLFWLPGVIFGLLVLFDVVG